VFHVRVAEQMVKTAKSWQPAVSVIYSDLDDGIALLETRGNVYYSLAGAGAFLWRELLNGSPFPSLCAALTDRYEVGADIAQLDVAEWIEQMTAAGLIQERGCA
jgi:hypothetical protein